jgi:hypothetical protein
MAFIDNFPITARGFGFYLSCLLPSSGAAFRQSEKNPTRPAPTEEMSVEESQITKRRPNHHDSALRYLEEYLNRRRRDVNLQETTGTRVRYTAFQIQLSRKSQKAKCGKITCGVR